MTALIPLLNDYLQGKVLGRYFHNGFYSHLNKSWLYLARGKHLGRHRTFALEPWQEDNLVQEFPPWVQGAFGGLQAATLQTPAKWHSSCILVLRFVFPLPFIFSIIECLLCFRHCAQTAWFQTIDAMGLLYSRVIH